MMIRLAALVLALGLVFGASAPAVAAPDLLPVEVLDQIGAREAWQRGTGSGIVVAVVDSGVALHHAELQDRPSINEVEAQGQSGIDDDGNGFVDDVLGWDFVDGNGTVGMVPGDPAVGDGIDNDEDGVIDGGVSHGTYAAGLIAGRTIGVAPSARILPVRVLDDEGSGDTATLAEGIDYAWKRGAQVIYVGVGYPQRDPLVGAAVERATEAGSVVVAPAGNTKDVLYPAAQPRVLGVGSHDGGGSSAFTPRGGPVTVNAPGTRLYTTRVAPASGELGYARVTGTSYSAAIAAGAVALLRSAAPALSANDVLLAIVNSARPMYCCNQTGALDVAAAMRLVLAD